MTPDEYKQMHVEHHNKRAAEKGFVPEALWGSAVSQRIRFEVLSNMFRSSSNFSVADIGCGLGDFYPFLRERGFTNFRYVGLDLNSQFIAEAATRYPDVEFVAGDLPDLISRVSEPFDYAIASGIYNLGYDLSEALRRVRRDLELLQPRVRVACGVNFLSTHADSRDPMSLYFDPAEMLRLGTSIFGRYCRLYHDYLPHDFTLLLFKQRP
jgi:SAM-dependent methyltransferase